MSVLVPRTFTSQHKQKSPLEDFKSRLEKLTNFYRPLKVRDYSNVTSKPQESKTDFARLARHLTGRSFGLALGGGGARGIAHIGVLRAFTEAGIPVIRLHHFQIAFYVLD